MIKSEDGGGGFLDRASGDVDDRPIVAGAELPGEGQLLSDDGLVDIIGLCILVEGKQPVAADLGDALGAGDQTDDEGPFCGPSCGGTGMPSTRGMLAVLMPRLAR